MCPAARLEALSPPPKVGYEGRSNFVAKKGKLPFPTSGLIEVGFGRVVNPRFNTVVVQKGIDIRAPLVAEAGAQVLAPADGVVHFAGFVVDRPVLSIEHVGGVLSSFEPVQTSLVAGDRVTRGEVIGTLLPGHCGSPCLHLGVRVDGEYVNPLLFLGGVGWSVLYPSG